jgi:hypothetical protein
MARINTPQPSDDSIRSLSKFLEGSGSWHALRAENHSGMFSDLWYRGVNKEFQPEAPGVYRETFTDRAEQLNVKGGIEDKRLCLERNMISQFQPPDCAWPTTVSRLSAEAALTHAHYRRKRLRERARDPQSE